MRHDRIFEGEPVSHDIFSGRLALPGRLSMHTVRMSIAILTKGWDSN
jgi:hypothetical protein